MIDVFGALVAGWLQMATGNTVWLMLAGVAIGFMVGILPGLGGPAALALMLPLTFTMQPVEAFAFLLGMAAVTATTGDITSVLFGVPGEAISAATVIDGHAMAKQGAAGRALGAALMSSLVGACLGAFTLALAIAAVRPLVLAIGYSEFFMLALLGVTLVAALSGGALLKGLVAAAFGVLLSMVGMDANTGVQRFTFGQLFLWDGVGLVAVVMGIFAIPEIIDLARKGTSIAEAEIGKLGGVMEGVKDTFRHWKLVLRCSVLGTFVGVIPGMGAPVAQWVAYAHAVQSSPRKERFGRGAVEGVLGPGAANNSALGGVLVPTIAFGVPGSTMMAILLGAFLIQGLVPGPSMLIPERDGGHLGLTFSFVWIIVISNIVTVAVSLLFLGQLARITRIRATLVVPLVLLLVFLGTFAEKNAFEDLALMVVFGALGWLMTAFGWPRPPLLLGLVLGPILENNLFLSMSSEGMGWLWRPGVWIIASLIVAGLVYSRMTSRVDPVVAENTAGAVPGRLVDARVLFTLALAAVFAFALWQSAYWGWRSRLVPWAFAVPALVLTLGQLALSLTSARRRRAPAERLELDGAAARIWATIVGFFLMIWLLGFPFASLVATAAYLVLVGRERWVVVVVMAGGMWVLFAVVFHCLLHIPFPDGALGVTLPSPC